jgi:hypothetical protein
MTRPPEEEEETDVTDERGSLDVMPAASLVASTTGKGNHANQSN